MARWQLAGCLLYLVMIVVTAAYHVPHNDALALVDPDSAGAGTAWRHYLSSWTAWNHVRTLACAGRASPSPPPRPAPPIPSPVIAKSP